MSKAGPLTLPLLISGLPGAEGSDAAWGPENGDPPLLTPSDHSVGPLGEWAMELAGRIPLGQLSSDYQVPDG